MIQAFDHDYDHHSVSEVNHTCTVHCKGCTCSTRSIIDHDDNDRDCLRVKLIVMFSNNLNAQKGGKII